MMIGLSAFIKECERDLVLKKSLSKDSIALLDNLSDKDRILCKPILDFITSGSISVHVESKEFDFLQEERILVNRLIPLCFALNTSNPTWSSYMLTKAVAAATNIEGIKLSEIGIAFFEILAEFNTPLNYAVYNFCIDISREFTVNYRERRSEFKALSSWENSSLASVAFLRYALVPIEDYKPKFILETMTALVDNSYFEDFIAGTKALFEEEEFRHEFLELLSNIESSKHKEKITLAMATFL